MTKDEIIRMAREAGFNESGCAGIIGVEDFLERFAALVSAHEKKFWMEQIEVECNEAVLAEREACAKVCDEMYDLHEEDWDYCVGLVDCAAAIRARGE